MPRQDGMTTGPAVDGSYEYYLTARNSLRIGAGWANPKFDREHSGSRTVRIGLTSCTAGREAPSIRSSVQAPARKLLQGIDNGNRPEPDEIWCKATRRPGNHLETFAIKGEARYDAVQKANGYDPSECALDWSQELFLRFY
jgi:hypothetical protein